MISASQKSVYSLSPGFAMEASVLGKLKEKTGRSIEEWTEFIAKSGPQTEKERRTWLKEQGLTTNYARFVAERASGKGGAEQYNPESLIEGIFAGNKSDLLALYEEMLSFGLSLGSDVKVCPCQTIIPFYRTHVFSQIKVPNRSRIDLGVALGDLPAKGRLTDTGGFAKKDRITHRIEIESIQKFDAEAKQWWKRAYDRNT